MKGARETEDKKNEEDETLQGQGAKNTTYINHRTQVCRARMSRTSKEKTRCDKEKKEGLHAMKWKLTCIAQELNPSFS